MECDIDFEKEGKKFLDLFAELEDVIKKECKRVGISTKNTNINDLINNLSKKNSVVRKYKEQLDLIRKIRNINIHNKCSKGKYVVFPNPEINTKFEEILKEIKEPPMIYNSKICIKKSNMFCRDINDSVYETIKIMSEMLFTHVPVFENNKLVGVFSENTLLDIVRLESGLILDEKTSFNSIREALKIENHSMEEFDFISIKTNIYDIDELFKNYFSSHNRIGCLYITEHGEKDEDILGMLTAWDVLGN